MTGRGGGLGRRDVCGAEVFADDGRRGRTRSGRWDGSGIAEEVASAEEEENGVNEEMGDEGMCDSRKDAIYH